MGGKGKEKRRERLLPVERTPGTGRRWGMSVGIDWTSQALHCAENSATVGGEKLAIIRKMTLARVVRR